MQTTIYDRPDYRSDLAAYKLSRMLGLRMIPPSVEREVDGVEGVVRLWIENLESLGDWLAQGNRDMSDSIYLQQQLKDQAVFDLLFSTVNRDKRRVFWDPDYNLWMMDQTLTLGRSIELRIDQESTLEGCSRNLYESIKALVEQDVRQWLRPYLGTFEIAALMRRRDKLIHLIDSEIERKGEDQVLFDYAD